MATNNKDIAYKSYKGEQIEITDINPPMPSPVPAPCFLHNEI